MTSWARPEETKPYLAKAFALSSGLSERQRVYVAGWYSIANLDYPQAIRDFRRIVEKYPDDPPPISAWAASSRARVAWTTLSPNTSAC